MLGANATIHFFTDAMALVTARKKNAKCK